MAQFLKNVDLNKSLSMESLFVSNDLHCDNFPSLVIQTLTDLSKAALSQESKNLIPIREMISLYNNIIPNVIVKAKIRDTNRSSILWSFACRGAHRVASTHFADR